MIFLIYRLIIGFIFYKRENSKELSFWYDGVNPDLTNCDFLLFSLISLYIEIYILIGLW